MFWYIFIEYCSLSVSIPLLNLSNKWMLGQQESAIQKQHCDLGHKYSSCIHTFYNNPTPRIVLFVLPSVRFFFTIRLWIHVLILDHDHYQLLWPWNRTKAITMIMISGQFWTVVFWLVKGSCVEHQWQQNYSKTKLSKSPRTICIIGIILLFLKQSVRVCPWNPVGVGLR